MNRGHVFRSGTGWGYVVDVGVRGGRRRQQRRRGFKSKRDAQDALGEVLSAVRTGAYVPPSSATVESFLLRWQAASRARVKPSTAASYEQMLRSHVVPRIGEVQLQSLSAAHLNELYAALLADGRCDGKGGLSASTVQYIHRILSKAFGDAVRWNLTTRNAADLADAPRADHKEMQIWTPEQVRTFLDSVKGERLFAAWLLAVTQGMRRGEVLGLRWADVDLDAGRISIQQSLVSIGYQLQFSTPKSKRSVRTIGLDASGVAALKTHRARQVEERLACGAAYSDNDLVFAREDGSPFHPERLSQLFERHVKSLGLPRIRLHDLRHTHVSIALASGVPPKVVSEWVGHASVAFTLDRYGHVMPGQQEQAAVQVAEAIFGAANS